MKNFFLRRREKNFDKLTGGILFCTDIITVILRDTPSAFFPKNAQEVAIEAHY
jgi:hypothetical protein